VDFDSVMAAVAGHSARKWRRTGAFSIVDFSNVETLGAGFS